MLKIIPAIEEVQLRSQTELSQEHFREKAVFDFWSAAQMDVKGPK